MTNSRLINYCIYRIAKLFAINLLPTAHNKNYVQLGVVVILNFKWMSV